jgi:lipoate-protein ligase B
VPIVSDRCEVHWLGRMGFDEAYRRQLDLVRRRRDDLIPDTLLLLEHPPTITLGRSARAENILVPPVSLEERGITLYRTDRGGDVTCHGPGQLIGYPIVDLRAGGRDIPTYIHDLEEVLIRTLAGLGIPAGRDEGHPGVWVGSDEIAAIGLAVKHGVSMHGFALNVDTDPSLFSLINPCGFRDRGMTSVSMLRGDAPGVPAVARRLVKHFGEVFQMRLEWDPIQQSR